MSRRPSELVAVGRIRWGLPARALHLFIRFGLDGVITGPAHLDPRYLGQDRGFLGHVRARHLEDGLLKFALREAVEVPDLDQASHSGQGPRSAEW